MNVRCAIGDPIRLFDCTFVLHIVSIVLVTGFLDQILWQRLSFILHVFLKLVWALAQGRPVHISWPTCAFLWLEVFLKHVGEEA